MARDVAAGFETVRLDPEPAGLVSKWTTAVLAFQRATDEGAREASKLGAAARSDRAEAAAAGGVAARRVEHRGGRTAARPRRAGIVRRVGRSLLGAAADSRRHWPNRSPRAAGLRVVERLRGRSA